MAKLRKMMGELDDPAIIELMALIQTQSKETLSKWTYEYVKENYLPLYLEITNDDTLVDVMRVCAQYLAKEIKISEVKLAIKEARSIAQKCQMPVAQAFARAISTAMATITTPTNALGFCFYGACGMAYFQVGINQDKSTYDQLASQELAHILESLKKVAISNEAHPVNIKWNC